jgi:hypothetical protein
MGIYRFCLFQESENKIQIVQLRQYFFLRLKSCGFVTVGKWCLNYPTLAVFKKYVTSTFWDLPIISTYCGTSTF